MTANEIRILPEAQIRNGFEIIWFSVMELIDFRRMETFLCWRYSFFFIGIANCSLLFDFNCLLKNRFWIGLCSFPIQNNMIYEISRIHEIATFWPFHQCYFSNSKSDKMPHFIFHILSAMKNVWLNIWPKNHLIFHVDCLL